ncbi:MAG: sialate O-acetylesterase [Bacteroidota bacterium]
MKSPLLLIFSLFSVIAFSQSGDLILFIGQSNMAGRADIGSDTLVMERVMLLNSEGAFASATNPMNRYSTIRKENRSILRLSPAFSFCQEVVSATDDSVFAIVQARGGTAIEKFQKGSDWGYYEAIVNRTRNTLAKYPGLRLRAVIMHQGESNQRSPGTYLGFLHQMVADLRADLDDPDLPFIFGEVGPWNPSFDAIRAEMKKIPEIIPFSQLVSSDNLTNRDASHFDRESVLLFGRRYAEVYLKLSKRY